MQLKLNREISPYDELIHIYQLTCRATAPTDDAPAEWLPLLARYQLVPTLLSESIIAQAIAPILCTLEETAQWLHPIPNNQDRPSAIIFAPNLGTTFRSWETRLLANSTEIVRAK